MNPDIITDNTELEFMRKCRFVKIQDRFSKVADNIQEKVDAADDDDIFMLVLDWDFFGLKVTGIKVVTEEDFRDMAF